MDGGREGWVDEWGVGGLMNGWDGWKDGGMNGGWMGGWMMDGWVNE